jgi:hypothetical protein
METNYVSGAFFCPRTRAKKSGFPLQSLAHRQLENQPMKLPNSNFMGS